MLSKNDGAGSGPSGPLLALAFEVSGLIEPTALLHATPRATGGKHKMTSAEVRAGMVEQ